MPIILNQTQTLSVDIASQIIELTHLFPEQQKAQLNSVPQPKEVSYVTIGFNSRLSLKEYGSID